MAKIELFKFEGATPDTFESGDAQSFIDSTLGGKLKEGFKLFVDGVEFVLNAEPVATEAIVEVVPVKKSKK